MYKFCLLFNFFYFYISAKKPLGPLLLKILLPILFIIIIAAAIFAVLFVKRRRKAERDTYLQDFIDKRRKPVDSR